MSVLRTCSGEYIRTLNGTVYSRDGASSSCNLAPLRTEREITNVVSVVPTDESLPRWDPPEELLSLRTPRGVLRRQSEFCIPGKREFHSLPRRNNNGPVSGIHIYATWTILHLREQSRAVSDVRSYARALPSATAIMRAATVRRDRNRNWLNAHPGEAERRSSITARIPNGSSVILEIGLSVLMRRSRIAAPFSWNSSRSTLDGTGVGDVVRSVNYASVAASERVCFFARRSCARLQSEFFPESAAILFILAAPIKHIRITFVDASSTDQILFVASAVRVSWNKLFFPFIVVNHQWRCIAIKIGSIIAIFAYLSFCCLSSSHHGGVHTFAH